MNAFKVNDTVFIKSTTDSCLSSWCRQARDNRTPCTVIAVDYEDAEPLELSYNVKVEYFCPDGYRMTALFKHGEVEAPKPLHPKTGDLFARAGNDGMTALVIAFSHFEDDSAWVYGITLCPVTFAPMGAPRLMEIRCTDKHICICFPLPECAQYALTRHQQIAAHDTTTPEQAAYLAARRAQIAENGYSSTPEDVAAAARVGYTLNVANWGSTKW